MSDISVDDISENYNRYAKVDKRGLPHYGFRNNNKPDKCAICGKPSFPYVFCQTCREHGTVRRALKKMEDSGAIIKTLDGRGKKGGRRWKVKPAKPFVRDGDKLGRNDQCSCGSGKKYKNCCLK